MIKHGIIARAKSTHTAYAVLSVSNRTAVAASSAHTGHGDTRCSKVKPAVPFDITVPHRLHRDALDEDGNGQESRHDGVGDEDEPDEDAVPGAGDDAQ